MLTAHRALLMNWFRAMGQLSGGVVESLNTKAKLTTRKRLVFAPTTAWKSPCIIRLAIYQNRTSPTDSAEEAGI